MLIKHIEINHFRGIKTLDWHINGRLACLVGPGDSTKTTILDAIELALAPRWYISFSDADFYQANTESPLSVSVTIGELPDDLLGDEKCGLYLRGYRQNEFNEDPEDGWESVITVKLVVSSDLEPQWELFKESLSDTRPLSWRERGQLGMARLGDDVERHLTWSRGSALTRITESGTTTGPTLAIANRAAHAAIFNATTLNELDVAAEQVREAAKEFGVNTSTLHPGLDTQMVSFGSGALSLHDEKKIPLRAVGLGSRRLTGLAIQQAGLGPGAILLIDEIEHGLEPHRIRRLLNKLTADHSNQEDGCGNQDKKQGQVLMTTHSPTAIMTLPVSDLRFVRTQHGKTIVEQVDLNTIDTIQRIVRKLGHALLARKIIVCEGKTEEALCRVLDDHWANSHQGHTLAYAGVVAVYGEGRTNGPLAAQEFSRIGYDVTFLGDSDEPIKPNAEILKNSGVNVILWQGKMATEQRLATDLPWNFLQDFINVGVEVRGESSVLDSIGNHLKKNLIHIGKVIDDWTDDSIDESMLRKTVGEIAHKQCWFKDLNTGEKLAQIAVGALSDIEDTPFAQALSQLEAWVYDE